MKKSKKSAPSAPKKVGNTKPSSSYWWSFTINNYSPLDIEKIRSSSDIDKYVFQEEIGDNGTQHLQGTVRWVCKKRLKTIQNWEKQVEISNKGHWEKNKNNKHCIMYCSDPDKRAPTGQMWSQGILVPKPLRLIYELRPWQLKVWNIVKHECMDDRTIHWVYDRPGKGGKTVFGKWLCAKHNGLMVGGKAKDMHFGVADSMEKEGCAPPIIIINIPRASTKISYEGLESIKDGIFFSAKYKSTMCMFNSPHVVVFANFLPENIGEKLSLDKWNIINLGPPESSEDDTDSDASEESTQ